MKKDLSQLIQECDLAIRSGRPQEVARRLAALDTSRVARQWRLPLANLCRRAGLNALGLTLLWRVVNPPRVRIGAEASDPEIAEYAVLLLRTGAVGESLGLLARVNVDAAPEALLYSAFGRFIRFEYDEAVPLLARYLSAPLTDYQALVGEVNLAFALVGSGQYDLATDRLGQVMEKARSQGHTRLQTNCRSMMAEIHFNRGDYEKTRLEVEASTKIIGRAATNDLMFLNKWTAFLEGVRTRSLDPIEKYRASALEMNDWNGAREADHQSLRISFDPDLFHHLIFGTPYSAYRERIFRDLGRRPERPVYAYGSESSLSISRMNLADGSIDGAETTAAGRKGHQLLEVLLRDFYQPLTVAGIFSELFPAERFNVHSSPDRVHQLLRRTRRWLAEKRIPVAIQEDGRFYSVRIEGGFCFEVPLERRSVDGMSLYLEKLKSLHSNEAFTAREAVSGLEVSKKTALRILRFGVEAKKIERLGEKNATTYRFAA